MSSNKSTLKPRPEKETVEIDNFFETISHAFGPFGVTQPSALAKEQIFRQVVRGRRVELPRAAPSNSFSLTKESFNRLLTAYGVEARVGDEFIKVFFDGGRRGLTRAELRHKVDFFVKVVLWKFGSHLRALRDLCASKDVAQLLADIPFAELNHKADVLKRMSQAPTVVVEDLSLAERKTLGYTVAAKQDAEGEPASLRRSAREKGSRNSETFLYSHHVDVYLAGSMREEGDFAEFQNVGKELEKHFRNQYGLRLVIFDPTLCWYPSSADKGLLESLMLKKATIGVMIAGNKDTFGKDSEAAQLLGQGKPVIVYASKEDVAKIFREIHPLRMQVSPTTGVAHGITVVSTPEQCAEAAGRLLLHELEVEVLYSYQTQAQLDDPDGTDAGSVIALVDKKADPVGRHESVLRVVTNNPALTRAFWSRYFDPN